MTSRIDDAVALIKALPEDDQERAAAALLAFVEHCAADPVDDRL